jgi:two-component system, LuxR family, sensor kinase FixL
MQTSSVPQPVRPFIAVLIYLSLHLLLSWLMSRNSTIISGITPWHPQAGLTLALLILYGPRLIVWPIFAIALSRWIIADTTQWQLLLPFTVIVATVQTLAAQLFRVRNVNQPIATTNSVLQLIAAGTLMGVANTIAYWTLQVPTMKALGQNDSNVTTEIVGFLVGQLNGVLTITPLMLWLSYVRKLPALTQHRVWELVAQIAATTLALWLVLGWQSTDNLHFYYPLFIVMVWIAFRWGVTGAVLCALTIQILLIVVIDEPTHRIPYFDVQLLILALVITGMILGAVATDRLSAQRHATMREIEQQTVMTMAPDAIIAIDSHRKIVVANPAALRLFADNTNIVGINIDHYLPNIELIGTQGRTSMKGRRDNGANFTTDVTWAKLNTPSTDGFLLICRDESERIANESQLRERDAALARATRFAIVGELASGLTHELNQPITALVSYLRAAQILAAPIVANDPRLEDTLNKASTQAIRAADVLHRLRDFYRGSAARTEVLNIFDITERVVKTHEDQLQQADIECQLDHAENVPELRYDQIQVEMILHNLLNNAIESLCSTTGIVRRVRIKTRFTTDTMMITIEDSGSGVAEEIASRLFEPFVTTKPDGMGLGLAISRSLLRSQGGDLRLARSELGGACFTIQLPFENSSPTTL